MLIIMTITMILIIIFFINKCSLSKTNNINNINIEKTNDSINDTNVTIRRKKPNKKNDINNDNNNNSNNNISSSSNNNNSNNNNNENNSKKNHTTNKDNFISPSPSQNSKETVFILGDSMVKKLNSFLLTRKLSHKCLVKVRPFNSAKVRYMHDHVKPTVRDFNPDHIILYYRTNELTDRTEQRTGIQITRSIIELALSLKFQDKKILISRIVPRNYNLNDKASEVNSRLVLILTILI